MSVEAITRIVIGGVLFWVGVYVVTRNIRSKLAWVIFLFTFSLSWYIVFVDVITTLYVNDLNTTIFLNYFTNWTYILPIPLVLHLSILTTKNNSRLNRYSLIFLYAVTAILVYAGFFTDKITDAHQIVFHSQEYGYFPARGSLFILIAPISFISSLLASLSYLQALNKSNQRYEKLKFGFAAVGSILYTIIGPFLVYIYQSTTDYNLAVYSTSPLLIAPFALWIISIFFFRLVSDIEEIFDLKEFTYLSIGLTVVVFTYWYVYSLFLPRINKDSLLFASVFMYLTIFAFSFYDWLTTFIRDLLYNAGRGFSVITDNEVADLVKNFHNHEILETNSLLKFKSVKNHAENGKLVDAAQEITREAISYFKQADFPRRTKQNLKYQLLKMLTLDDAEEGQILWELGFDGYPMKIMSGEDSTRKPLFKVESMSDYTATSRNAFIALKKEAIHDLGWRLSYIEKTSK